MIIRPVAEGGTIDLKSGWDQLWNAVSGVITGQVTSLLTIAGVILLIFAIGKFIFDKRRGGGHTQGLGIVVWTLVAGALLAAPQIIIPTALTILDYIINAIVSLVNGAGK